MTRKECGVLGELTIAGAAEDDGKRIMVNTGNEPRGDRYGQTSTFL
jgi:hypothetical protein